MPYTKKNKKICKKTKKGGFFLSDLNKRYLLTKIKSHINKYLSNFDDVFRYSKRTLNNHQINLNLEKLSLVLNSKEYLDIYNVLFNTYIYDRQYYQVFITTEEFSKPKRIRKPFFNSNNYKIGPKTKSTILTPYHINFASVIFFSFLLEYEMFLITNINKSYNVNNEGDLNINETSCLSTYSYYEELTYKFRVYKSLLMNPSSIVLENFAKVLDNIFDDFMTLLVDEYSKKTGKNTDYIYSKIVPINHKDSKYIPGSKYIFDHIYVNWKNRIRNPKKGLYMTEINEILMSCLAKLSGGLDGYIAEGTGFFSFVYLDYPNKSGDYFGSCITWSLIELYIMSRLHTNGDNMFLDLELDPSGSEQKQLMWWHKTCHWGNVQRVPPISHWSTSYILHPSVEPRTTRHIPGFSLIKRINIKDKGIFIRTLLYPILDSYEKYIETCPLFNVGTKTKYYQFINNRVKILESYFGLLD